MEVIQLSSKLLQLQLQSSFSRTNREKALDLSAASL
ncbi:unnamed protein product [Oikopleura dioica]|uniref:Uncharacterized protein n=1 Tax=Oikopleura dioica TaxID=34765 RepID=E4X2U4_OIKDI|nr:unnamed protein product [Oikopleura dioica]